MSSLARLLLATQKSAPPPPTSDQYFPNVVALIHGNGTNGSTNQTFMATNGTTNYSLGVGGAPAPGAFSPYGSNWSVALNTSTASYLTYGASTSASPAAQAFTMECWVMFNTLPTTTGTNGEFNLFQKGRSGTSNYECGWSLILNATGNAYQIEFQVSSNGSTIVNTNSPNLTNFTTGIWYHFALTSAAASGIVTYWFNGTNIGTSNHGVTSIFSGTGAVALAENNNGSNPSWEGYISNFRVVYGSTVYTTNFTPPTAPLSAITGTNFLSCASNRFIDKSTNAWIITANGSPQVSRFNPFGDKATPYATATYGGSVYFGVTGNDYLTGGPAISITGDFTMEGWVYYIGTGATLVSQWATTAATDSYIFGIRGNGSNNLFFSYGQGSTTTQLNGSSAAVVPYAWNHIAVSRAGSTLRFFVNGVLDTASNTISGALNVASVGQDINTSAGSGSTTTQYLADIRIVNGTAVYTATFTPPTAPLTAITNTAFLYHGTDAAIFDNAMQQCIRTPGTVKISTTQQKWGSGSLSFDGSTTACLVLPNSQIPVWGAVNWTIEFWMYPTSAAASGGLFGQRSASSSFAPVIAYYNGNVVFQYSTSGSAWITITSSSTYAVNAWYHVAIVRNGSTITMYVNGTSAGTSTVGTSTLMTTTAPLLIGINSDDGNNPSLTGYMQDFRITFGLARYTANFTPPTATFPNQ